MVASQAYHSVRRKFHPHHPPDLQVGWLALAVNVGGSKPGLQATSLGAEQRRRRAVAVVQSAVLQFSPLPRPGAESHPGVTIARCVYALNFKDLHSGKRGTCEGGETPIAHSRGVRAHGRKGRQETGGCSARGGAGAAWPRHFPHQRAGPAAEASLHTIGYHRHMRCGRVRPSRKRSG